MCIARNNSAMSPTFSELLLSGEIHVLWETTHKEPEEGLDNQEKSLSKDPTKTFRDKESLSKDPLVFGEKPAPHVLRGQLLQTPHDACLLEIRNVECLPSQAELNVDTAMTRSLNIKKSAHAKRMVDASIVRKEVLSDLIAWHARSCAQKESPFLPSCCSPYAHLCASDVGYRFTIQGLAKLYS